MVDKNDLAKCLKTGHIFDTREAKKKQFRKTFEVCMYVFHWIISSRINLLIHKTFYIEY